jgi:truncated hemoglobin YjbI
MENKAPVTQKAPLYDRLGREPRLREIVDDIIDRIAENPFLEHYFHDVDKGRIKILAYEYFSMKMGGPDPYTGPDLHSTFFSMNVRPEEYDYALDDTLFILDEKGIGQPERKEIIAILEDLRADIVRVRAV